MNPANLKELLSERLHKNFAYNTALYILDNPSLLPELYQLTEDNNPKIEWKAMWICERICAIAPEWFMNKRSELMIRTSNCKNAGTLRSILNILLMLPVEKPISVEFLNCCMDKMLSPQEPTAVQSLCLKMAYNLCKEEPELLPELRCILQHAETEFYSTGTKTTIKNILKRIEND
jgi:hypothetical protein